MLHQLIVGVGEPFAQHAQQLEAERIVAVEGVQDGVLGQHHQMDRAQRPGRGRARQVAQHRHLAEDRPLRQDRQARVRPADIAQDLDLALLDHKHGIARVAFVVDDLSGVVASFLHGILCP